MSTKWTHWKGNPEIMSPLWSYLDHSIHFGHIRFTLVLLGPLRSNLVVFGLIQSNLVLLGPLCPIWFYSVHLGPIWSILSTLILFGLIWSYYVYSVHFGPIRSFSPHWFYSVHFVHFSLIKSTSVQFSPFYSLWFHSVHSIHFGPIWSISVLFGPLWSYYVPFNLILFTLVHLYPLWSSQSIFVHLHNGKGKFWLKAKVVSLDTSAFAIWWIMLIWRSRLKSSHRNYCRRDLSFVKNKWTMVNPKTKRLGFVFLFRYF